MPKKVKKKVVPKKKETLEPLVAIGPVIGAAIAAGAIAVLLYLIGTPTEKVETPPPPSVVVPIEKPPVGPPNVGEGPSSNQPQPVYPPEVQEPTVTPPVVETKPQIHPKKPTVKKPKPKKPEVKKPKKKCVPCPKKPKDKGPFYPKNF